MKILKSNLNIDFIKYRKLAASLSIILMIGSIAVIAIKNLNWGLDFTGGTSVQVEYETDANLIEIRNLLEKQGFEKAVVQNFGTAKDVMIRLAMVEGKKPAEVGNQVVEVLQAASDTNVEMKKIDFVSASVGDELTEKGGIAILVALICILIYVSLRFEWKFALGSVAALVHDVVLTLGIFSLIQMEFDLTVLAAVLAVIGYSLNDTIVVFDRIRENFLKLRKQEPSKVVNISLNQTLARTLVTSLTTLLVLAALFFLGGETIHGFATALIIGVLVGTYSSIYVASNVALTLGVTKEDLMQPEVEKEGADENHYRFRSCRLSNERESEGLC
jgi:preprotein translocase subunit SecF